MATVNMTDCSRSTADNLHLFYLPQEILDTIFDFAYPRQDEELQFIFKQEWDCNEDCNLKDSELGTYVRRPFPAPKVNDWMVSKRFLPLAAAAWFGNQRFRDGHYSSRNADLLDGFMMNRTGLFFDFARQVEDVDTYQLWSLELFKSLRVFGLEIREKDMELNPSGPNTVRKLGWHQEFTDEDFASLEITSTLQGLSGLKRVTLTTGYLWHAKSDRQVALWNQNLKALEMYLTREIIGTRSANTDEADRMSDETLCCRLYSRSLVCKDCSRLMPEEQPARMKAEALWETSFGTSDDEPCRPEQASLPPPETMRKLRDADIPTDNSELVELIKADPHSIASWIQKEQTRLSKKKKHKRSIF